MKYSLLCLFLIQFAFGQSYLDYNQDTLYQKYSIDQILEYRKDYNYRIRKNIKRQDDIRNLGLKINEEMLGTSNDALNQDFMLIRAAEYINDKVDSDYDGLIEKYFNDLDEYEIQLAKYEEDTSSVELPIEPEFPIKDYSKSIELYDKVINNFAYGEMVDDALYLKAYLLQEMQRGDEARDIYNELIDKYPDSKYTPHALMLYAEYFFTPSETRDEDDNLEALKRSILLYKRALRYTESSRYDEALYRLGWAYYRLAVLEPEHYASAIYYFTRVIDDITRAEKLDPDQKRSRHAILPEAVQYIGICFYYMEEDGQKPAIQEMREYVETLLKNNKTYADAVLKSLGDVYYSIQSDDKTIQAYGMMQELFPYYKDGADIQYRIVEAYRGDDSKFDYKSDSKSFAERYKLFKKYNSKSEWYKGVEQLALDNKFEILSNAEKNAERALAENITLLYQDAQDKEEDVTKLKKEGKDIPETMNISKSYLTLAQYCREYLDHFPLSKDAPNIHFSMAVVLDQKLHHWKDAYNEFIVISNSYPEAPDQLILDAAINAVIVADTLYASTGEKNRKFEFDLKKENKPEPLIPAEERMIEAYENYIKISPTDSRSAAYLSNISAIYYNRKQFALANRYNKTLLAQFPGTNNEGVAREQILNGYLAKRQFLSAEAVARKILKDKLATPEQISYAKLRLADAILLNAQQYEAEGKHFLAGLEFRRVALEAPFEERPDYINRALMKSADSFQKEKEYEQAIESLEMLLAQVEPQNSYRRKALINLSVNYADIKHFTYSGELSEKIYLDYPDSLGAKDYLYNASVLYERGKSWKDAIRVNNRFSNRYPTDENSKDMLFRNAGYFLKLDDFENANVIYDNFAKKYPDDPRTIQAFYERGKYYLGKENIETAKTEFNKAINKHESFASRKKEGNRFYAAESSFELIKLLEKDYESIKYKWPKRAIDAEQARKRSLLVDLTDKYEKLMSYGSPRSLEAPFRIAEAYESFAQAYAEQETNPNERNVARRIVERQKVRNTAANLYNTAINEYKLSFERTEKIADKLIELSMQADTVKTDNKLKRSNEIDTDSLRNLSNNFIFKAKERVTSLVFTVAKQSEENVKNAVDFKTEFYGKIGEERKDFIARKKLLNANVKAQVDKSIEAYRRNLKTADELQIENKYTEESKRRIVMNNNILADEFKGLANQALEEYRKYYDEFIYLIPKPYGRRSKTYKKVYADLSLDVEDFLNYATEFITESLNAYKTTILKAREDSIYNDLTEYTELSILTGPLSFSNTLRTLVDSMKVQEQRFKKTYQDMNANDPDNLTILNYEDAIANLEGFQLAVKDNILAVLDEAYLISKELKLPNTTAYNQVLKILIESDPQGYAKDIPRIDQFVVSNSENWKVTNVYSEDWMNVSLSDSVWKTPYVINDTIKLQAFDTLNVQPENLWYVDKDQIIQKPVIDSTTIVNLPPFEYDSLLQLNKYYKLDSLGEKQYYILDRNTLLPRGFVPEYKVSYVDEIIDTVDVAEVFYKTNINLDGRVYSAKFIGTGDGNTSMFLNGMEVVTFLGYNYGEIEIGNTEVFGTAFKVGKNEIAFRLEDDIKPRKGFKFYLHLEVLPKEFSQTGSASLDETVRFTPSEEKYIQEIIKNRIIQNSVALKSATEQTDQVEQPPSSTDSKILESTEE